MLGESPFAEPSQKPIPPLPLENLRKCSKYSTPKCIDCDALFTEAIALSLNEQLLGISGMRFPALTSKVFVIDIVKGLIPAEMEWAEPIRGIGFCRNDHFIVFASGSNIVVQNVSDNRRYTLGGFGEVMVTCLAVSPDGRVVAVGFDSGRTRIIEAFSGQVRAECVSTGSSITALSFDGDGCVLGAGTDDGCIFLYRMRDPKGEDERNAPSNAELETLWDSMADGTSSGAWVAMRKFATLEGRTVRFFEKKLARYCRARLLKIDEMIAELGSSDGKTGMKAENELREMLDAIEADLVIASKRSVGTVRVRLEGLIEELHERRNRCLVRVLRAIEVLEAVGSWQARSLLAKLSKWSPKSEMSRDADASLGRLEQKANSKGR